MSDICFHFLFFSFMISFVFSFVFSGVCRGFDVFLLFFLVGGVHFSSLLVGPLSCVG